MCLRRTYAQSVVQGGREMVCKKSRLVSGVQSTPYGRTGKKICLVEGGQR